jgi:aerotaxis receptor
MDSRAPLNREYDFEGRAIISQTDLKGVITFVNRQFCNVSGYKVDELVGQPHNIVRHPDMPRSVFEKMWKNIKSGQVWHGLVKNLRKDGQYYWVNMEVFPIKNDEDEITGYISTSKPASATSIQEHVELYKNMIKSEES